MYEAGLEDRLIDLHSRVHRGAYQARPSRRVYIPKADGRQRPLGIAALGDKIVQQAVVTILNQIYEVDFKGFSYGFRPGRGPHQALDALTVGTRHPAAPHFLQTGLSRAATPHVYLSTVIDETTCDIACVSWQSPRGG
jgi:retron-type reverse transcriptase